MKIDPGRAKAARERLGISPTELARRLTKAAGFKVAYQSVQQLETGMPKMPAFAHWLPEVLDTTMNYLTRKVERPDQIESDRNKTIIMGNQESHTLEGNMPPASHDPNQVIFADILFRLGRLESGLSQLDRDVRGLKRTRGRKSSERSNPKRRVRPPQ